MANRTKRSEKIVEKLAVEQVQAFATAGNFPKTVEGVRALADALDRAARDTGLLMAAIVRECLDSSAWCPTPFDLRGVALSLRDKGRENRSASIHAAWERIYGPADPDWASRMVEAAMLHGGHADRDRAVHELAIRDMLYYTEGDGREMGDREFWKAARKHDLRDHPALVEQIRVAGRWATERELQGVSRD